MGVNGFAMTNHYADDGSKSNKKGLLKGNFFCQAYFQLHSYYANITMGMYKHLNNIFLEHAWYD